MADSSSNATATTFPTDEPSLSLWNDRTNLEGLLLQGIVYGIHVIVFVAAMNGLLFSHRGARSSALKRWLLAAYTFFMFAIGTFMVGANMQVCVSMFVDNRNFIEGPSAWIAANFSLTANTFGNVAYVLGLFAADALLLYRAFIVWNKNVYVMIGPGLLFLASSIVSFLVIYESVQPTASFWTKVSANMLLISFSLSIPLNLILTTLIMFRLWRMSRYVKDALGDSHARAYTSIAAMMAESAAPYSICGIIFIATFAANSPGQNLFLPPLGQVMCLSPELIIWRVASGRAWSEHTTGVTVGQRPPRRVGDPESTKMSDLRFANGESVTRIEVERKESQATMESHQLGA